MAFSKEKAHDRAERYAAKGQHDKAAREYQQIVDHDPKDIRAWLMLADCLVRCGDAPRAIARYLQVAQYYVEQQQPQKALAVYRQVLNLDQARIDVQLKVASLNMQLGRIPDAIALYERIAQVQLQAGQVGKALEIFKLVADADPGTVSRRLRLAELYSRERRNEQAVEAFRAAGQQLLAAGRKPDYVRVAERLLYHDAGDRATIRELARVYLELGDPRRALMKLNALLHSDSSDRVGIELLAETFVALGKVDKAVSVIGELARELKQHLPETRDDAIRVLRRGLEWAPRHPSFVTTLAELESSAASYADSGYGLPAEPAPEEIEQVDSDVVEEVSEADVEEIDEDDLVMDEEAEPGVPEPVTRSLTDTVLSEARAEQQLDQDSLTDFDKILFEARVYVKYRLFDHALDHVESALQQEPDHLGALSLRARTLTELGRLDEAADSHLQVARRVAASDPKLAREHIAAAVSVAPNNAEVQRMATALGQTIGRPARAASDDGDSGMFDVVAAADDLAHSPGAPEEADEADDTHVVGLDLPATGSLHASEDDDDFSIDVQDEEPATLDRMPPPAIENRFGVSHSGPLPRPAIDADDDDTDQKTPPSGYRPRPPGERVASSPSGKPASGLVARTPSVTESSPASTPPAGFIARPPVDAHEHEHEPALDLVAARELPTETTWPDISEDLAEIRFFMDQGLDDDADHALAELRKRYPGHPELAAFAGPAEDAATQSLSEDAAQPLIDVEEDTTDEDDYLAAIFGEPERESKPVKGKELRARLQDDEQDVDAQTAFDLGLAYREMGLVDDALGQFELAARDKAFRSRALVMMATLRVHRGETDRAVSDLQEAVRLARNPDESSEANYELGLLYEKIGNTQAAVSQLQAVAKGFRDRDQRLSQLTR